MLNSPVAETEKCGTAGTKPDGAGTPPALPTYQARSMSKNAVEALEDIGNGIDPKTLKRAQYEGFEFELEAPGLVRVRNASYGDDADDHTYLVNVEDGKPLACECPAFQYRDGPCKHQLAVAIRKPVLEAAIERPKAVADGGVQEARTSVTDTADHTDTSERPEDCGCHPSFDELPCWPCYRDGFETPASREEV